MLNATAVEAYKGQGPGIGAGSGALAWMKRHVPYEINSADRILEVGYGMGDLLIEAVLATRCQAAGVDIAQASEINIRNRIKALPDQLIPNIDVVTMDVSHMALPWVDDTCSIAFCTETIEHLSNPFYAVAEIKRVLKHGGYFILAFPRPEDNLGYGNGQHAHIYPGFLLRRSFEQFMRQMYFKLITVSENGSSGWYCYRNYKGPEILDMFTVVSGNYTEEQLFGCLERFPAC